MFTFRLRLIIWTKKNLSNLDEEIYPASLDPEKLMDFMDSVDDQLLASITKQ